MGYIMATTNEKEIKLIRDIIGTGCRDIVENHDIRNLFKQGN